MHANVMLTSGCDVGIASTTAARQATWMLIIECSAAMAASSVIARSHRLCCKTTFQFIHTQATCSHEPCPGVEASSQPGVDTARTPCQNKTHDSGQVRR